MTDPDDPWTPPPRWAVYLCVGGFLLFGVVLFAVAGWELVAWIAGWVKAWGE